MQTPVLEILGSNPDQDIAIIMEVYHIFPQSLQANAGIVL
jgi:hypothetical protein